MILPAVVNVSIWGFVLMSVECLKHSLNVPNVIWHQKSSSTCVTTAWSSLLLLLLLMALSLGSGGRRRFHTQFTQVFFTAGNSLYCSQIRADSSASNLRHVWALQQLEPDFSSTIKFFHCNLLISRLINLEYQLMLEIEIWHCFSSVKGRRNICCVLKLSCRVLSTFFNWSGKSAAGKNDATHVQSLPLRHC